MISTVAVVVNRFSLHIAGDGDIRCCRRCASSRAKSWLDIHRKNAESSEVTCFLPSILTDSEMPDREDGKNTPVGVKVTNLTSFSGLSTWQARLFLLVRISYISLSNHSLSVMLLEIMLLPKASITLFKLMIAL